MPYLRVLDLRGDRSDPRDRLPRATADRPDVRAAVEEVLRAVRERGDDALRELTARFDGVDVDDVTVPAAVAERCLDELDPQLRAALESAAGRIRWFHEQAHPAAWEAEVDGTRAGQRFSPVGRAGVYVPGGLSPYPSTVLMTAIPARVAGVDEVVLATPPTGDDALPDPAILAAAALVGVDRIVRVGGAQAVAALAYGTASVPRCDAVVGPGNVYVATAKQLVQAEGTCRVDAVAGPTEVAIVADRTADPRTVAADLVAQAEHDELATCLLVTDDPDLVTAVEAALDAEVAATVHGERVRAALHGQGTAVVVDDVDHAVAVADAFAAEHLEIHTADADAVAGRVRFAGTVFVGPATPVSLGDYAAGPNHTLPTAGTARFSGGLTTADFLVPVNWVSCTRDALRGLAPTVRALAAAEDLPAHARAVDIRLDGP